MTWPKGKWLLKSVWLALLLAISAILTLGWNLVTDGRLTFAVVPLVVIVPVLASLIAALLRLV